MWSARAPRAPQHQNTHGRQAFAKQLELVVSVRTYGLLYLKEPAAQIEGPRNTILPSPEHALAPLRCILRSPSRSHERYCHPSSPPTMPTSKISSRPQTLRQARRAYQKAGATTRLSERQMKQLGRSAELQERADRIKERENRRKANLKKKNERIEREREARCRMGIPSPVKEDVGASQMRLGAFLAVGVGMGMKTKCEGPRVEPLSVNLCRKTENEDSHTPVQRSTPLRSPLQPRSGNGITKPRSQTKSPKTSKESSATSSPCNSVQPIPKRMQGTKRKPDNPFGPLPMVSNQHSPKAGPLKTHTSTSMRPPPLPLAKPHKPPSVNPPSRPSMPPPIAPAARFQTRCLTRTTSNPILKSPRTTPMPPRPIPANKPTYRALPKPQPFIDEWADFLVSNTQIVRELSTPEPTADPIPHKPPFNISPSLFLTQSEPTSTPCPALPSKSSQLSTKDLLSQDTEPEPDPHTMTKAKETDEQGTEQEFGEDITDGDLEGAVLEAEMGAMPKLKAEAEEKTEKQTDSFYDDDFDFSTQELRDLVD